MKNISILNTEKLVEKNIDGIPLFCFNILAEFKFRLINIGR